jgi:hypothetical protein
LSTIGIWWSDGVHRCRCRWLDIRCSFNGWHGERSDTLHLQKKKR